MALDFDFDFVFLEIGYGLSRMEAGNKRKADDAAGNSEKRAKVSSRHFTHRIEALDLKLREEASMPC